MTINQTIAIFYIITWNTIYSYKSRNTFLLWVRKDIGDLIKLEI